MENELQTSPTSVPKDTTIPATAKVEEKVEVKAADIGIRPDGWEGVVWDCERACGCPDHCKSPEMSNLTNIINEMRHNERNLAIEIINVAKSHI